MMIFNYKKTKRIILGILQSFVALGAIPAGLSMIITPDGSNIGMSISILNNSPFNDFFIPGIVLFSVNGLLNIIGAVFTFSRYRYYQPVGLLLGSFLTIWIFIQIYLIGLIHFLQPAYIAIGIMEIYFSLSLRKKR